MAVARRGTAAAILSRAFIPWTSDFGSDHRCCAMYCLGRGGQRIRTHIAYRIARAALDACGQANLGGYSRRVASTGINAYRYALAHPRTRYRTPRRHVGSDADAARGFSANDVATDRKPSGEKASAAPIADERQKNPRVVRSRGVASRDPGSADAAKGLNRGGNSLSRPLRRQHGETRAAPRCIRGHRPRLHNSVAGGSLEGRGSDSRRWPPAAGRAVSATVAAACSTARLHRYRRLAWRCCHRRL
jgi:hypothetical protein